MDPIIGLYITAAIFFWVWFLTQVFKPPVDFYWWGYPIVMIITVILAAFWPGYLVAEAINQIHARLK